MSSIPTGRGVSRVTPPSEFSLEKLRAIIAAPKIQNGKSASFMISALKKSGTPFGQFKLSLIENFGGGLQGLQKARAFLELERRQPAIQLAAQQQAQQKAESDFLAKIQAAINKQLESFKVPQIQQTPMIESESQVKQVVQSPTSLIPLAIIGAVLLG